MYDVRNKLSQKVAEDARKHFKSDVFDAVIPRNVRLSESPSFGKPIILYDVASKGAAAYLELADEVIRKNAARTTKPGKRATSGV